MKLENLNQIKCIVCGEQATQLHTNSYFSGITNDGWKKYEDHDKILFYCNKCAKSYIFDRFVDASMAYIHSLMVDRGIGEEEVMGDLLAKMDQIVQLNKETIANTYMGLRRKNKLPQ